MIPMKSRCLKSKKMFWLIRLHIARLLSWHWPGSTMTTEFLMFWVRSSRLCRIGRHLTPKPIVCATSSPTSPTPPQIFAMSAKIVKTTLSDWLKCDNAARVCVNYAENTANPSPKSSLISTSRPCVLMSCSHLRFGLRPSNESESTSSAVSAKLPPRLPRSAKGLPNHSARPLRVISPSWRWSERLLPLRLEETIPPTRSR